MCVKQSTTTTRTQKDSDHLLVVSESFCVHVVVVDACTWDVYLSSFSWRCQKGLVRGGLWHRSERCAMSWGPVCTANRSPAGGVTCSNMAAVCSCKDWDNSHISFTASQARRAQREVVWTSSVILNSHLSALLPGYAGAEDHTLHSASSTKFTPDRRTSHSSVVT